MTFLSCFSFRPTLEATAETTTTTTAAAAADACPKTGTAEADCQHAGGRPTLAVGVPARDGQAAAANSRGCRAGDAASQTTTHVSAGKSGPPKVRKQVCRSAAFQTGQDSATFTDHLAQFSQQYIWVSFGGPML